MKRWISFVCGLCVLISNCLVAQEIREITQCGYVLTPSSSIAQPNDLGIRMHTNLEMFVPQVPTDPAQPPPTANTPASLACIYQLVPQVKGCPINGSEQSPSGGWGAIAIVDAYDNPNAEDDLATFSTQFGLPPCTKVNGCFSQVYATGTQPKNDPRGWSLEEALDIEIAHAFAPNAKIILVEAADNKNPSLYLAEDLAAQLVQQAGGGVISNSWTGVEYVAEADDDVHFQADGIVYFASTGDSGGAVGYPAASPFVVASGGTTINRSNGNFTGETGWKNSAGGPSIYEPRPSYQDLLQQIVGTQRGTPDFSAIADPSTGVAAYDADGNVGWTELGGTSVASPLLAGVVDADGYKAQSTARELNGVYRFAKSHYQQVWRDETKGADKINSCKKGWDFVTGVGSPITGTGK